MLATCFPLAYDAGGCVEWACDARTGEDSSGSSSSSVPAVGRQWQWQWQHRSIDQACAWQTTGPVALDTIAAISQTHRNARTGKPKAW